MVLERSNLIADLEHGLAIGGADDARDGGRAGFRLDHDDHIDVMEDDQPAAPIAIGLDPGMRFDRPGKAGGDEGRKGKRAALCRGGGPQEFTGACHIELDEGIDDVPPRAEVTGIDDDLAFGRERVKIVIHRVSSVSKAMILKYPISCRSH